MLYSQCVDYNKKYSKILVFKIIFRFLLSNSRLTKWILNIYFQNMNLTTNMQQFFFNVWYFKSYQ